MNLTDYLDVSDSTLNPNGLEKKSSVFGKISVLGLAKNVELTADSLAIIGVCESRNSANPRASDAPELIRPYLYGLSGSVIRKPLYDLGNIKTTASPAETYIALQDVVSYLSGKGVTTLVLGGTQELTWPLYLALSEKQKPVNVTIVDHKIDFPSSNDDFSSEGYINRLVNEPFENIFSINLLAYQSYLTDSNHINILEKKSHNLHRLGFVRGSMTEVEPYFRDSQLISFDMGSIRQGDSPGSVNPSPNGLYAEEVCQLARYAGLSNRAKCFGLFELNPNLDRYNQSTHLAAQIAWHFIDAFNHRKPDFEIKGTNKAKRFFVKSPIPNVELVFIKSVTSESWWMELPGTSKTAGNPVLIACSHNDYKLASKGDVPDRWLKALKKMS